MSCETGAGQFLRQIEQEPYNSLNTNELSVDGGRDLNAKKGELQTIVP